MSFLSSAIIANAAYLKNETFSSITYALSNKAASNNTVSPAYCESEIKLFAYSLDGQFNKTGITHYHEGAGVDYLFLAGMDSPKYTLNKCDDQIYVLLAGTYKQWLSEIDGIVQLTVAGPNSDFAIEDIDGNNYLSVDGLIDGWEACRNTNDPYNYSKTSYQLTYDGHGFTDCIPVVVKAEYV